MGETKGRKIESLPVISVWNVFGGVCDSPTRMNQKGALVTCWVHVDTQQSEGIMSG